MNRDQKELLEKPFVPTQIKQRQGTFGQTLDYIEGHSVIARLNDVFESNWSFQVLNHEILENEVVVLGELMCDEIRKSQFGCSGIARNKDTGKVISLGSDLKAASTDSLKRCAMLLGIGLQLYAKEKQSSTGNSHPRLGNDNSSNNSCTIPTRTTQTGKKQTSTTLTNNTQPINNRSNTPSQGKTTQPSTHSSTNDAETNLKGRISSKQHQYLISLGQDMGLSKHDLNRKSIEGYGSAIAYLSKQQASEMIQSLRQH